MNVDKGHCCERVSDNFVFLSMYCVSERLNHTGKHELHIIFFTLVQDSTYMQKKCVHKHAYS